MTETNKNQEKARGLTEENIRQIVRDEMNDSPESTRRAAMKAGGILGLGALTGGGGALFASGGAQATGHSGTIGTASNPVNIEAHEIVGDGRDLYTTASVAINVPADFSTIQDAIDAVAFLPYHSVEIDVDSGFDGSTEDILVSQTHAGEATTTYGGFEHKITVTGDTTTPSNNPLGSVMISGFQGGFITFRGFDLQHDNPYKNVTSDDDTPFAVLHTDSAALHDCEFSGGTTGVLCYGESGVDINGVDFGASVLTGHGVFAKHGGTIQMQRDGSASGNVGKYAYRADAGTIQTVASHTLSGSNGTIDTDGRGGIILEEAKGGTGWNVRYVGEGYDFANIGINDNQVFVQGTEPGSHSAGDIWIDNS